MKKQLISIFPDTDYLAAHFAGLLKKETEAKGEKPFTMALSGGSTPAAIFRYLSANHFHDINWTHVLFFWGDERCVDPDHKESNFRMAKENLLGPLGIPQNHIFRIYGELPPEQAASSYSRTIMENTLYADGLPRFDMILLGLGEDGHTASLFPGDDHAILSKKLCETVTHPQTGQKRVTLTFPVINGAEKVVFLVTGAGKAEMVKKIFEGDDKYPASLVKPVKGELLWLVDEGAGGLL
jgi:6-phosphogluconolactonase